MNDEMTIEQAYTAMYSFLGDYYRRNKYDDVGALLGSMGLMSNNMPLDRAMWDDWLKGIAEARAGEVGDAEGLKDMPSLPSS